MNERIKDILAHPVFERLNDWVNIGPVQRATLEEFAELIVNECASLFEDDLRPMGDFTERACRRAIKEHFGVKE